MKRTALIFVLALASLAHATGPYYVSTTGDNGAAGTSTSVPWATLSYALDNAVLDGATPANNVIYLMSGAHAVVTLSSKTWDSTSWSNKWTVTGLTGATIEGMEYQGVHGAYLEFNGVAFTRSTSHNQSLGIVHIIGGSDLRFYDLDITGYWDESDSLNTSGFGLYLDVDTDYIEDIDVNGVDIEDVWQGFRIIDGGGQLVRNNISIANVTLKNWNQSAFSLNWYPGSRDAYDQVELNYLECTEMTRSRVSSSTSGWPHSNAVSGRADNWHLNGAKLARFGGSGGIRFYDHAYPAGIDFSNITIENCILFGAEVSTICGFYACGENVIIRNNTFVSSRRDASTPCWRYIGGVIITKSTGVTADIQFTNNICACRLEVGEWVKDAITSGNNLIYSHYDGSWRSGFLDVNDLVVCQGTTGPIASGFSIDSFETSGDVFVGSTDFEDYFPIIGVDTFDPPSDWTVFDLPATSFAVDGGRPSMASTVDTVERVRDATPDIGAFEYVAAGAPAAPTTPSPATGDEISVACWVEFDTDPTAGLQFVVGKWSATEKCFALFAWNSDGIRLGMGPGDDRQDQVPLNVAVVVGRWYHIGATFDDATAEIDAIRQGTYKSGESATSATHRQVIVIFD